MKKLQPKPMTEEETNRWLEIRFYHMCLNMSAIRNNVNDIIRTIEYYSTFGNCNQIILEGIVREIFEKRFEPNIAETIILAAKNGYDPRYLAVRFSLTRLTIYRHIQRQETDKAIPIFRRGTDIQAKALKDFFEAVDLALLNTKI